MNTTLLNHVLKAAVRDKMILSLILVLAVAVSLSIFLGSAAVVEKDQFSLVFTASSLRLSGVFGVVLFVVFFIRRSFDAKDIEFLLSRPIGRVEFVLSYAAAFVVLGVFLGVAQGLALYSIGSHLFSFSHLFWVVSIMAENIIMALTAFFFAMILSSASVASMACLGFYVLARMMGQILGIIYAGTDFVGSKVLVVVMQAISMLIPRLDLLGQSGWLIYGVENQQDIAIPFVQLFVFGVLIVVATMIDLVRRQF